MEKLMDEKTAMNVEFLRARLLSERIVSRTARQRSEILAQRVMELEEQLRIVNIQRKEAEKAAEEVLSILEKQGITCTGELTDSSTDQEKDQHTDQEGDQCISSKDIKEDESFTTSRLDRSKVQDFSSLSWKSHGSSPDTLQKQKTKMNRFNITMKSSQRLPGKSCRKIRRHDAISSSENELEKSPLVDAHGNGVVFYPEDFDENHECGMERALEQQAQLIVQFQDMENTQKDWEEKFNESKMSMLENPEPGNNQVKIDENSFWLAENSKHEEEDTSSVKNISFTENMKNEGCRNCEMANKRASSETSPINVIETVPKSITSLSPDNPNLTRKTHLGPNFENFNAGSVSNRHAKTDIQIFTIPSYEDPAPKKPNTVIAINSKMNTPLTEKLPPNRELFKEGFNKNLGSVLQSLHRARISLTQELDKKSSSGRSTPAVPRPANSSMKPTPSSKDLNFPMNSSVLFRLPSNSLSEIQLSGASIYGSGLRLTATRPDLGLMGSSGDQYPFNPYMYDNRVQFRREFANNYPVRYVEPESRVSAAKDYYYHRHLSSSISPLSPNEYPNSSSDLRIMTPISDKHFY